MYCSIAYSKCILHDFVVNRIQNLGLGLTSDASEISKKYNLDFITIVNENNMYQISFHLKFIRTLVLFILDKIQLLVHEIAFITQKIFFVNYHLSNNWSDSQHLMCEIQTSNVPSN